MYHHGISFLPGAIDPDLSRGHPLFFFAIAATWMDIFGSSHVAMHSFALFISVGMLIAVYEVGLRLFNQRVAVMSTLLIATQTIFFVQSSFVLLEVLVALLVFLSIYCYTSRHYFLTTLCLTALFYTKESGLVAGVVLGLDALTGLFNPAMDMKKRLSGLASVILPCVLVGIFFIVQKIDRGWYVFPLHSSLVEHIWGPFWYRFRMACLRGAFEEGFRFYYFITLPVLAIIAAIKNKSIRYLALFPAAFMLYYFVDDLRCGRLLSSIPNFIIFLLSVFLILYIFSRPRFYPQPRQRRFIVLTGLFVYCYFCFSGMNFFTLRYIFAALLPLLFLTAVFYDLLISQSFKL